MIFPKKNPLAAAVSAIVFAGTLFAEDAAFPPAENAAPAASDIDVPDEKLFSARTEYFSFSAETSDAATRAADIAREIESYFSKTPRLWKKHLPNAGTPVRVELFREPGIFRIADRGNARITLFLSEDFSDDFRLRSRLCEALLLRMFFSAGKNVSAGIPPWLVAAVAEESRLGNVFGRQIFLRKKSLSAPPISPSELISAPAQKFESDAAFRINALWFLRAVGNVSPFLNEKKPTEKKLAEAFPKSLGKEKADAAFADVFWATRFRELVARAPDGVDLPDESRRVFDDALLFLVEKNGEETRVLAGDLVASREREEIRRRVEERFGVFAAHFHKANPVWHNAFAEYGVFLEMFGNPDVPAETLSAQWDKTIFARESALAIQREVLELAEAEEKAEAERAGTPFP